MVSIPVRKTDPIKCSWFLVCNWLIRTGVLNCNSNHNILWAWLECKSQSSRILKAGKAWVGE